MPAMLDDPASPTIYRTSGAEPFPDPHDSEPAVPEDVFCRQVTLRDRVTAATVVPFTSHRQVPLSLLAYLSSQLNKEIENGDTYPMMEGMPADKFAAYWFQNFGAIMLLGNIDAPEEVVEGKDWSREVLGSFYIKPNYPGRSSHICNAGFLVTDAARNRGVGRLMGECYLEWAPRLGYVYSVFNLVFETNVASCRIWDALGFKRIGRVKGAGNLKSYPGQLIDAIIYGRDLGPEGEDFVSEERFDKIKFYLKYGKYPAGADRAEKSRLRSAATHYKLLPDSDKLMLKDKEVISDPQKQYEIARNVHVMQHGGINKTTATIAESYHWVRIKETVSLVIKNCTQCKELMKAPVVRADGVIRPTPRITPSTSYGGQSPDAVSAADRALSLNDDSAFPPPGQGSVSPQVLNRNLPQSTNEHDQHRHPTSSPQLHTHNHVHRHTAPIAHMQQTTEDQYLPLDPQIMEDVRNHLGPGYSHAHAQPSQQHHGHHEHHNHHHLSSHSPSPSASHTHDEHDFQDHDHDHDHDPDSFQAMLGDGHGDGDGDAHGDGESGRRHEHEDGHGAGNDDLDMLIDDADVPEHEHEHENETGREGAEGPVLQLQAEAAARAAEEALRTVGREYGGG